MASGSNDDSSVDGVDNIHDVEVSMLHGLTIQVVHIV